MLQHMRGALPRNRCRYDDGEPSNLRGGRDADDAARGVEDRTAGESVMHRRRHANDLLERLPSTRPEWTADHGHDAAVAVNALLHDRAAPSASWPTRAGALPMSPAAAPFRPGAPPTRWPDPSQPALREFLAVLRRDAHVVLASEARDVVRTVPLAYATPLTGRRRPCTCTTEGPIAATASAICSESVQGVCVHVVDSRSFVRRPHHPDGWGPKRGATIFDYS
jgi:hypothetical protein